MTEIPEEFLEPIDDDKWKQCVQCSGKLTQKREALFICLECGQEYNKDEEDMRS